MFGFHGWVTVREGTSEADEDDARFHQNIQSIEELVQANQDGVTRVELVASNGQYR